MPNYEGIDSIVEICQINNIASQKMLFSVKMSTNVIITRPIFIVGKFSMDD